MKLSKKELMQRVSDLIEDEETKIINKITVSELIKKLNRRDRTIIDLRYFKDKTQFAKWRKGI